ncbi:MAG: T9SS type A sorting domain-containing protein, partial [Calditrichales bacterium]|nr:T9SS type A sorting domain-containing protein [Calditrichales bacterium]
GYEHLLNIPEYDFRYRKILNLNGTYVMGFYHGPVEDIDNIWIDGTGHIACAYLCYGDKQRGYFYSNQLDKLIIERIIGGNTTHALPYTANKTGDYGWVDINKGFISCCAWYIFAKNEFNPLLITDCSFIQNYSKAPYKFELYQNFPNPFNSTTAISYQIETIHGSPVHVELTVYNILGQKVAALVSEKQRAGYYKYKWDAGGFSSGVYYYRLKTSAGIAQTKKLVVLK